VSLSSSISLSGSLSLSPLSDFLNYSSIAVITYGENYDTLQSSSASKVTSRDDRYEKRSRRRRRRRRGRCWPCA